MYGDGTGGRRGQHTPPTGPEGCWRRQGAVQGAKAEGGLPSAFSPCQRRDYSHSSWEAVGRRGPLDGHGGARMMQRRSRSGGIGRRASFRSWFPQREWRFESSLRHLDVKGLTANNAVGPFAFPNPFGDNLGKGLGSRWRDVA